MAMITDVSAHGNVSTSSENKTADGTLFTDDLPRFYMVMAFADRMLEKGILTAEEYADFSVKTAQSLSLKIPQNQGFYRADNLSDSRHNEGWNHVHDGGDLNVQDC